MRLTRENNQIKNEKKKIHKNKSLLDEIHNIKYKLENQKLSGKIKKNHNNLIIEKPKEKTFKDGSKKFPSNSNIYQPNKNIRNKQNPKIQTELDRNSVYAKNKAIVMNSSKNINKGSNINFLTNNLINENNNNEENTLKKNKINNNENIADYNITKKSTNDIYNTNDNKINQEHIINDYKSRMNRVKEAMGNVNKKIRIKNTSMDHRYSKFSGDIVMSDGDLMTDDDNVIISRNRIYPHPYKFNSQTSIYNNVFRKQFSRNNGNIILNNNIKTKNGIYYYNKDYQNLEEIEDPEYGDLLKLNYATNFNNEMINKNRNRHNSLMNYNGYTNKFNFTNDIQSKTINSFYIHKSPMNSSRNINNNLITNKDTSNNDYIYTNYLNYLEKNININKTIKKRNHWHSMMEENEIPLSPYKNRINTNNNYLENLDGYKSNRRSKNKIRITKKNNNNSIQEYNVSLGGDNDNDEYQKDFNISNNLKNKMILNLENKNNINDNNNINENLKIYYDNFYKNIQPIANDQFNISSTISKINITNDIYNNLSSSKKTRKNVSHNKSNLSNSKSYNNLMITPYFSDTGKTPKKFNLAIDQKIKPFEEIIENNNSNYNTNTISNNEDNNSQYKMVTKRKAKNDIPIPSTSGLKRNNSSSSNVNKNLSKIVNNNFEICQNEKINFYGKERDKNDNNNTDDQNKFVFKNENDIIDYIFNKFEEERKRKNYFNRKLRFTGFVLSKKYKGKNLYDVRIEDDIDKINQQLKDDKILINDKQVEFRYIEDEKKNKNNDNNINELNEEYNKLKLENEKLNKKDVVKNELIKKLDREKQNFLEEIEQLKKQINELKNNNNINNNKLRDEENKLNKKIEKKKVYDIENNKNIEEEKSYNYESELNKNNKYNDEIYSNDDVININKKNDEENEDKNIINLKCIENLYIINKDNKNKIMNKSVNNKNRTRIYNTYDNIISNKEEINKVNGN